jgi:cell division protein FtsQ
LKDFADSLAPFPLAPTAAPAAQAFSLDYKARAAPSPTPPVPARPAPRHPLVEKAERLSRRRFFGTTLVFALFGLIGLFGAIQGGAYAAFIQNQGSISDQIAKAIGFPIKAVTITGAREMSEGEILAIAGVGPRKSLVFLNVADLRARLKAVPLIKEASVSKLFPNRLLIEIEERQPYALWQKDGSVSIVSADGTPIDELRDPRYESLPLVTGEGANLRIADYVALLDAAGDLRPRIRAGIFVAGRRWTLKTTGGIEIALPEKNAADALSRLALLEHDSHILEKDILSLDLRVLGRVVARLSEDAASAREAALAKKSKPKGTPT